MTIENMGRVGQLIFSAIVSLMFAGVLFVLIFKRVDLAPGIGEVLLVLVGGLAREFGNVGSFWLGTSLSSAKKDATIAAASKSLAP